MPVATEQQSKDVTVKLPRETWKALKIAAVQRERSISELLDELVREYLKGQKKN